MLSVLIVEDAANIRTQLVRLFEKRWSCYEVEAVGSVGEARAALAVGSHNLALLDLGLPSALRKADVDWKHGRDLLRQVKRERPHVKVIILSTHGELVRDFLKEEGADDFFLKDRREDWLGDKLPSQVERLIGHLGCCSEAGRSLRDGLAQVGSDSPVVVIEGEPGTGKKHAADVLHRNSARAHREMLVLPTQGLRPETLMTDMVGEEGALPIPGLLEGDTTGTIVFDHAQDLRHADALVQASLVQLLTGVHGGELHFTPLGGTRSRSSPCSLVFCFQGRLSDHLDTGWMAPELAREFRKAPRVSVPGSRERVEDVPEITEAIRRHCNEERRDDPLSRTEPEALEVLQEALDDGALATLADLDAVVQSACRRAEGEVLTADGVRAELPTASPVARPVQHLAPVVSRTVAMEAYRRVEQTLDESEDAASRMQHLDRLAALGEMVSGVVHELGTPMTAILAAASTMDTLGDELTAEQTTEMTQILCEESRRMRQMIEDLRHFSRRGDADQMLETDVEELVASAVKLVRLEPKAKHLSISVQSNAALSPLPLFADRIKQVLLNILRNAVEAVDPKTGAIEVALSETGESVVIALRDNGSGMPPDVQSRVFEPFFTTKGEGGTGVGLDISRKIVEAHGGTIAVDSTPGEGTTFTITLPRAVGQDAILSPSST